MTNAEMDATGKNLPAETRPEVLAFANYLRALFDALDTSIRRYEARCYLDKGTISRFLSGQRVASAQFLEGLIRNIEEDTGNQLTPEVKEQGTRLRLAALKVTNSNVYEIESLRDQLGIAERELSRMKRYIIALQEDLKAREQEARDARRELQGYLRDRASQSRFEFSNQPQEDPHELSSGERESLIEEISRLREELANAERMRAIAEKRCQDLEEHLGRAEEKYDASSDTDLVRSSEFEAAIRDTIASTGEYESAEFAQAISGVALQSTPSAAARLSLACLRSAASGPAYKIMREFARIRTMGENDEFFNCLNDKGSVNRFLEAVGRYRTMDELLGFLSRRSSIDQISFSALGRVVCERQIAPADALKLYDYLTSINKSDEAIRALGSACRHSGGSVTADVCSEFLVRNSKELALIMFIESYASYRYGVWRPSELSSRGQKFHRDHYVEFCSTALPPDRLYYILGRAYSRDPESRNTQEQIIKRVAIDWTEDKLRRLYNRLGQHKKGFRRWPTGRKKPPSANEFLESFPHLRGDL